MVFIKYKNNFVSYDVYRHLKKKNKFPKCIYRKNSYIPKFIDGISYAIVYQGNKFAKVKWNEKNKGFRFGNFVTTRRIMRPRNKKKKKSKKRIKGLEHGINSLTPEMIEENRRLLYGK
jgi:ribosomal protein S19